MCDKNKWACPHFFLANKKPVFIYLVGPHLKFEMLSVVVFVLFMWLLCFLFTLYLWQVLSDCLLCIWVPPLMLLMNLLYLYKNKSSIWLSRYLVMLSNQWQGDPQKIPKAVLHQLCQRSGWEAPKFNKVMGQRSSFSYAVSVLRRSSGRGKSRKSGGLITLQLPDQEETFESAEVPIYPYAP